MNKNKLTIGFVFDDSLDRTDGVQQYITTVGRWLLDQGHDVYFLVGDTKAGPFPGRTYSLAKNFTVSGNGNRLSIPLPANRTTIKEVFDEHDFDVLHVQAPFSPMLAGRVIKHASAGTKIIGTFHIAAENKLTILGAKVMGMFQRRSIRKFDLFISVSKAAQDFAIANYGIQSVVVSNVIQFAEATTLVERSATKIVFLGRLVVRKGCEQLVKAFSKIDSNYTLTICGDGPQRKGLESQVAKLELSSRVEFLGRVSEEEKYKQLASARLAVFPSLGGESFGIVLLEAMSVGTIVLGGDNQGYRTVLEENDQHNLVDPSNTDLFVKKMSKLLKNEKLRKQLEVWQADHIQKFDIYSVGPKILELYRKA